MKVYIVTKEPYPNGMAATNRIKCYSRALHEGGIACEVIISRRTESPGQVKNFDWNGFEGGVPFRYVGKSTRRHKIKFVRLFTDYFDRIKTSLYLKRNILKGDALFLYMGGDVRQMMRYMRIAKKRGAYCVRDLCEYPYGTGDESNKAIYLRKITIEKQFPKLDGIISISDALLNFAKTYTLSSCRHLKVPILVEYERFTTNNNVDRELPYIFHAGTLQQQKDGILGMLEAFGIAKQYLQFPIRYILTGTIEKSSHPDEIRKIINKYHLEGFVEFIGYIYPVQVKEYLSKASLVISNRVKSRQDFYGFSTKVGEYLASGVPLITTDWGEIVNWLKDGESAYIVEAENTQMLSEAIIRVFNNPEEAVTIGKRGQMVCRDNFDYHNWSKPIAEFFSSFETEK